MKAEVVEDGVVVTMTLVDETPLEFNFREIQIRGRKFDTLLSVWAPLPGMESEPPFEMHVDALSPSNVNSYRLSLTDYYGPEVDWKRLLPKVLALAKETYLGHSRVVDPEDVDIEHAWEWDVERLVVARELNILFGQGESAKSYLAQSIVMHSALNVPWLSRGMTPKRWLWLDYESVRPEHFAFRRHRLALGGHPWERGAVSWMAGRGVPIVDYAPTVRRELQRTGADGLVVDSLAFACGGDALKQEVATAASNALINLGVTVLANAHVTKDEQTRTAELYPFGSIFWHNAAHGLTWNLKRVSEEGSDEIEVGWYNRKAPDGGGRQRSFGTKMRFDGERGPVTVEGCEIVDIPLLEHTASLSSRIVKVLRNDRLTIGRIAEELSLDEDRKVSEDSVRKTLGRMKTKGVVVQLFEGGKIEWCLRARQEA